MERMEDVVGPARGGGGGEEEGGGEKAELR